MLSSANVTASAAGEYYEKDDYYSRDMEGVSIGCQWYGKGAQALGLVGEINPETFKQLLEGKAPDGSSLHAKTVDLQNHRAGTDFTFSAPKSVSIAGLVQRDGRVIQAHDRAVRKALDVLEEHSQARVWNRAERQQERIFTGNIAVATFRHETSRNQDAQLHTHAVVINASQLLDGSWRALSNEEILNNKKLLGEVYQNELAFELRQLGYEIEPRENGQFDLKGYDKQLLDTFSSRRQAIEAYVAQSTQPHTPQLYEQATLQTRSRKEVLPREALVESWQRVVAEQGLALPDLPQNRERDLSVEGRDQAAIAAAAGIAHAQEREAIFRRGKVEQFALETHLGQQNWEQLQGAINATNQLVRADAGADCWTTQHAIQRELDTIRLMRQGQGVLEPIATAQEVAAIAPDSLTRGQRAALELSVASSDRVLAWQGVAGAGKSYALNLFRQMAEANDYQVKGFAPSAEGAKVLGDEAGIASDTVASLLCSQPDPHSLPNRQVWLVDEAGLLGAEDAHALLQRAQQEQARIVLIGDTKQLSSVGAGNPFKSLQAGGMATAQLQESLRQKSAELRAAVDAFARGDAPGSFQALTDAGSIRELQSSEDRTAAITTDYLTLSQSQRQKTLILANSNAERQSLTQAIRQGLQAEGSLAGDTFTLSSLRAKDLTAAQAQYAKNYVQGDILIPTKSYKKLGLEKGQQYEVVAIASDQKRLQVQDSRGQQFEIALDRCEKSVYQAQLIPLASGDRLKWSRNDRDKGLRNGQEFTVEAIDERGQAIISYADGRKDFADLGGRQFVDYAIVSTTYSSQGKTADRVLASLDGSTSKEAFYVAISRAKHALSIYTPDAADLRQKAERSKVNVNPSDYLDLFTYHPRKNAENQVRKPETTDRIALHPAHSTDRGRSIGSRAGIGAEERLAALLLPDRSSADSACRTAAAAQRTAATTRHFDDSASGPNPRLEGDRATDSRRDSGVPEYVRAGNQRTHRCFKPAQLAGRGCNRSAASFGGRTPSLLLSGSAASNAGADSERINQQLQQIDRQLGELSQKRAELRQQETAQRKPKFLFEDIERERRHDLSPEQPPQAADPQPQVTAENYKAFLWQPQKEQLEPPQPELQQSPEPARSHIDSAFIRDMNLLRQAFPPNMEHPKAQPQPQPQLQPSTLQDSVSLSVQEWMSLSPRKQITLVEAAIAHRQTEPVVTIQVEQWVGQEAHLKRQMKELSDRFKEELATVKELEARGQKSLLNPFGASAEQTETAQDAAQATQRLWKSHKCDFDQIQSRRTQRQQQEVTHEAWSAHSDTQGARRIRELLQDPALRSRFEEVEDTAARLKKWETEVARRVGRGDNDLEQIHLARQHYLDSGQLSDSYRAAMKKDSHQYHQAQKSQQHGWQL